MRSLLKAVMAFALTFIASMLLVATIKSATLNSDRTQEISSVKLPAEALGPCGSYNNTERSVTSTPVARYTAEAQRRGIVGTVRLAVYFDFDGKVSIAGVISRLPYGLTEEAIKAAKQIKFKPATSCNGPATEPAEIQYEFPGGQGRVVQ
jgi:TonB family protein